MRIKGLWVIKNNPVEIFEYSFTLKGMADLRVPLETVNILIGKCNRLVITDEGSGKERESIGYLSYLISMRCPDTHFFRVSFKDFIGFADLDINRAISAALPGLHASTKPFCYNMKAKADTKNG